MRWLILSVLLFAIVAIYADDEVETEDWEDDWVDDEVLTLTADNFQSFIDENEFVLVEFYAPWCEYCKSFAPEYAKVAKELEETESNIKVVKVDAIKETNITKDYEVRGYPTLKLFRNGKPAPNDLNGVRQFQNVIDWLKKKTGPIAVEIDNVNAAEKFIRSEAVTIIGFFTDRESDEVETFLNAADTIDDYRFGITSNDDVYAKYGAKSGSIMLFKEDKNSVFEGEVSKSAIFEFVAVQSAPVIVDFNRSFSHIVFNVVKSHLVLFTSKDAGHMEKYIEPAKTLAEEYRGKVLLININTDEDDHERIMAFFRIKKEGIPTMRLTHMVDGVTKKYKPFFADLSPDYIRSFVEDGLNGKLQEDLLSQDLPEDWDKAPVKTLVSTNFEEVVSNTDKDVFVAFYSPWSEECKELAPIYDELGEKYKDSETVVIAKIDATVNELDPKYPKVLSYPTLKLFKKGDNSISYYTGKKTLDGFVKFIESGGEEVDFEDDEEVSEEPLEDKDEL